MPDLELLWIPAVLGWIPLIYSDEISAFLARRGSPVQQPPVERGGELAPGVAGQRVPDDT